MTIVATEVANEFERYMLDLINADRGAKGLAPLLMELNLNTSADEHSIWMSEADTFSHTGAGGSTHTQRILDADMDLSGSWRSAENIAAVTVDGAASLYDEVDRLHKNLMNSPSHYANLMDPKLELIGLGLMVGPLSYGSAGSLSSALLTQNFATTGGLADLDLAGKDGADRLTGQGGDDHIAGGGGADTLISGAGADTIDGQGGNDEIHLGAGVKQVEGGTGEDTVVLSMTRAQASVSELSAGAFLTGGGVQAKLTGIEWLQFTDQRVAVADFFVNDPNKDPADTSGTFFLGTSGSDLLKGTGGADSLTGLAGDDVLLSEGRGLYGSDVSAQVYRLYSAVLGREPDAGGHLGWAALIGSGGRTLQEVTTSFVASAEFQKTYGALTDSQFVTLLYDNVLGRAPDAGGFSNWVGALGRGLPREEVVLRFSESLEHRNSTAADLEAFELAHDPTAWADEVYRLYRAVLDREPDEQGLAIWVEQLAEGKSFADVVSAFMGSPEFQATYGTTSNADFVTLLYNNVLDRAPDAGGFDVWTSVLGSGTSRETVVERFVQSNEFVQGTAADLRAFMAGAGPDDVLTPGAGNDLLSGGLWADTFVFGPDDDGSKTVTDFEAWDTVDLTGFGYADSAEAMTHVTQQNGNAVFEDEGVQVVFLDTVLGAGMLEV